MKQLFILAILTISLSAFSQEQEVKRPLPGISISLTDTIFIGAIVPRLNQAIKLVSESSIPVKDANKCINELSELLNYLDKQMLAKSKEEKTEQQPADKPKANKTKNK